MTDRKKLIALLRSNMNVLKAAGTSATATLRLADHLIDGGVTFATDNSVAYNLSPTEPLTMSIKYEKGYQPFGLEGFKKACPTCKNSGTALCKKCKMEVESGYDPKDGYGMTNADRIRSMSDEELAKWISCGAGMSVGVCGYCNNSKLDRCDGIPCGEKTDAEIILEWLKQPAEGE